MKFEDKLDLVLSEHCGFCGHGQPAGEGGVANEIDKADKPKKLKKKLAVKIMTPGGPTKADTPISNIDRSGDRPKDPISSSFSNPA